jgi:hypothetical protein
LERKNPETFMTDAIKSSRPILDPFLRENLVDLVAVLSYNGIHQGFDFAYACKDGKLRVMCYKKHRERILEIAKSLNLLDDIVDVFSYE